MLIYGMFFSWTFSQRKTCRERERLRERERHSKMNVKWNGGKQKRQNEAMIMFFIVPNNNRIWIWTIKCWYGNKVWQGERDTETMRSSFAFYTITIIIIHVQRCKNCCQFMAMTFFFHNILFRFLSFLFCSCMHTHFSCKSLSLQRKRKQTTTKKNTCWVTAINRLLWLSIWCGQQICVTFSESKDYSGSET